MRTILRRTGLLDYLSNGFVADTTGEGLRLAAAMLNRFACSDAQCATVDADATEAQPEQTVQAAPPASASPGPEYMAQSARVALDPQGNVLPAEQTAPAENSTEPPREIKERP